MKRFHINLATRGIRNRRLFLLLLSASLIVILGFSLFSVLAITKYTPRIAGERKEARRMGVLIKEIRKNEKQQGLDLEAASRMLEAPVGRINPIILKKSFSWEEFLTDLEAMLPESCFIIALTPTLKSGSRIEAKLRIASPGLEPLLEFISRLNERKFKGIRVVSERTAEGGAIVWELIYTYEKNVQSD